MINLGDSDDPYLIFESLNFKGEPLTQADLVRNYVLMKFRHSIADGGEQERVYNTYWRPMEAQLGSRLTEFLRYYAMRQGENIYLGGIYSAIKSSFRTVQTSDEVEDEVSEIAHFSKIFGHIANPELVSETDIRDRLRNLKTLNVTTSYPLLLRLFDAAHSSSLSNSELERCLRLIESFVVRRSVCGVPTNALNKLFLQWTRSFPADGHVQWLHRTISTGSGGRRFPNDAEFSQAFLTQNQYGRGATRFILTTLERSLGHKEAVDLSTTTIEHVMPQTLTPEWESEIHSDEGDVYERYLHTFGNLTLTGYNTELGNLAFAEKREKLATSHIEMNRRIVEATRWDEAAMQTRAREMLSSALKIWQGPISS